MDILENIGIILSFDRREINGFVLGDIRGIQRKYQYVIGIIKSHNY